jgi:hypothetical protein
MIISASRRTDIPAFYAPWFVNRLRAGYCTVPNPFNHQQVRRISLLPEDVDVIVFWTRSARPLIPYLDELDECGYRYYFQYTLLAYPQPLDPGVPSLAVGLDTIRALAEKIGPRRVIWRYDPIAFTDLTPPDYHRQQYERLAKQLAGYTQRSVISLMTLYPKIRKRLHAIAPYGAALQPPATYGRDWFQAEWFPGLMRDLVAIAQNHKIQVTSCAMEKDLTQYGVRPGKCIDDTYIASEFGLEVSHNKDPGQRPACGCVISRDIGMYDTCLFGCPYCYATRSFEHARINHAAHMVDSPSMIGRYEAVDRDLSA